MKKLTKSSKVLAVAIVVLLLIGCMGCATQTAAPATDPAPAEPASQAEPPADTSAEPAADNTATDDIYSYEDVLSLQGVMSPQMKSRAYPEKALPKGKYDTIKVGCAMASNFSAWFATCNQTVEETCEEYGFEYSMLVCDFDPAKQADHIDMFIMQGVDVILMDSVDPGAAKGMIAKAVEAGIPVITMGEALDPDTQNVTTIMAGLYEASFQVGAYTATKFVGREIIAGTMGVMGSVSSESHMNGYFGGIIYARSFEYDQPMKKEDAMMAGQKMWEEIRKNGKADYNDFDFHVVVHNSRAQWTEDTGMTAAEEMIMASNGKMNLLLSCNDIQAVGAIKALEQMGYKVGGEDGIQVVGTGDTYRPAMDYMKEGKFCAIAYSNPAVVGRSAVELAKMIFIDGFDANDMCAGTFLPVIIVTPENVDEYYDPNSMFSKEVDFKFYTLADQNAGNGCDVYPAVTFE